MLEKHLVFVYGTLKCKFRNHFLIKQENFIGKAQTADNKWSMIAMTSTSSGKQCPGIIKGASYISGELYEVRSETLEKLDALEKNGVRYQREEVLLSNNKLSWIYNYIETTAKLLDDSPFLEFYNNKNLFNWNELN